MVFLLFAAACSSAQTMPKQPGGKIVLVLPFDNRSGQLNLGWIGDSFPDTLNQRLSSAGYLPVTRDDRQYALDHLGLPKDFRPTRATAIRIAQNLDADYVIVGSFTVQAAAPGSRNGSRIQVQAQVLEVNKLKLSAPLEDSSELARLFDIENAIAWKVARQMDPQFQVAEQTFLSASTGIQLAAFENYIRGTGAPTSPERIRRLAEAVKDAPNYAAAELALGKELYTDRQFTQAAAALTRVPKADRLALEANFYLGLARFNEAKYAEAENAFAFVAARLPLPEVVNDQAVAQARQAKDGTVLFQRAVNTDPNDPDYHYNLSVSHLRQGDFAGAQREVEAALKLKPADPDAGELRQLIALGRPVPGSVRTGVAAFEPAERLERKYSEATFRQAASQLDQVRALRLATLPPSQQAVEYTQLGHDYLAQGLLPEAEQEFHTAIAADPSAPAGHLGMAQVREQSGNVAEARNEAQASLRLGQTADAYLVLARLDLARGDLPASAQSVRAALRLNPQSGAAKGMQAALASRGQALPQ